MPKGRILVADSSSEFLEKTRDLLSRAGYEMLAAKDGEEARALLYSGHPDGVMVSLELKLLDGLELCQLIRERHPTVPCYVMLPKDDPTAVDECFAAGARNVLVRPLKRTELRFAAHSLMNLRSLLRTRSGSEGRAQTKVPPPPGGDMAARAIFFQFELFKKLLSIELRRAKRYGFPLSVMIVAPDEPDDEPRIEGVDAPPTTLASRAVDQAIRDIDIPVQFSEDQILVVMPHTDIDGALVVAERIRRKARQGDGPITVSIGATSLGDAGNLGYDKLIARAVRALKEARAAGGDRVARA